MKPALVRVLGLFVDLGYKNLWDDTDSVRYRAESVSGPPSHSYYCTRSFLMFVHYFKALSLGIADTQFTAALSLSLSRVRFNTFKGAQG